MSVCLYGCPPCWDSKTEEEADRWPRSASSEAGPLQRMRPKPPGCRSLKPQAGLDGGRDRGVRIPGAPSGGSGGGGEPLAAAGAGGGKLLQPELQERSGRKHACGADHSRPEAQRDAPPGACRASLWRPTQPEHLPFDSRRPGKVKLWLTRLQEAPQETRGGYAPF